jgi:hypothetical protein
MSRGKSYRGIAPSSADEGYAKRSLERALRETRNRYAHAIANVQSTSVRNGPQVGVQNDADNDDTAIA